MRTHTPKVRYARHRQFDGADRGTPTGQKRLHGLDTFLTRRADTAANGGIGDTAALTVFTQVATVDATGVLTLTGQPLDGETVVIGGVTYTFQTTLVNEANNVLIGAAATDSIDNLIAAINRSGAIGTLTLTGQPLDAETVTIGGTTYTFETVLTDSADNVLIGAAATDSIDNLIAAISAGAGVGTLYGTGTVVNPDATGVAGVGDTLDLTAVDPGSVGATVATTEGLTNGSFGAATLVGGISTVYGDGTLASLAATGARGAGDTMDLTAVDDGDAGNLVATTEGLTNGSFGAATLTGGIDAIMTAASHGLATGDGPMIVSTDTTLPAGLLATELYWPEVIDANTFSLHLDRERSGRDKIPVTITDTGTGVHSFALGADRESLKEYLKQSVSSGELQGLSDIDDVLAHF